MHEIDLPQIFLLNFIYVLAMNFPREWKSCAIFIFDAHQFQLKRTIPAIYYCLIYLRENFQVTNNQSIFYDYFFSFLKKKSITISKWHLFLIWNDALNNGATQIQKIKKPNRSALLIRRFSRRFVTINLTACFTFDAQNLHQITWHWIKHKSVRVSNQVKCRANWPDILK